MAYIYLYEYLHISYDLYYLFTIFFFINCARKYYWNSATFSCHLQLWQCSGRVTVAETATVVTVTMSNQLFFLSLADIFSIYPTIFKELIATRQKQTLIYLPSDVDWKERMYYRLLEVQKRVNEAIDNGV